MIGHDRGALFFGLILPHGLLELTAVFVAAGVGLRLFWSWVEPGPAHPRAGPRPGGPHRGRRRPRAGRGAARVSGVIEAFVTPSAAAHLGPDRHRRRRPRWLFLAYVFAAGRWAAPSRARPATCEAADAGDAAPVAG